MSDKQYRSDPANRTCSAHIEHRRLPRHHAGSMTLNSSAPSSQMRQLGRSRRYTSADLPARLRHWHAPRANRWERLCVTSGALEIEWLAADGIVQQRLCGGASIWIAPGSRWRVMGIDTAATFQLEVHADDSTPASAPQVVRTGLLDDAPCIRPDDVDDFVRRVDALAPGQRGLVRAGFDFTAPLLDILRDRAGAMCWHPLAAGADGCAALIVHAQQSIDLPDYLGRDHAVIEAALAGALRGDAEHACWLRNALARHLHIEERILFPAYLDAEGNAGWVRGLCNEHAHLRRALDRLDDPTMQRRFLLLLDGHDEKEETIVYPDIVARKGTRIQALTDAVKGLGPVATMPE
jgi:hypothetical protein